MIAILAVHAFTSCASEDPGIAPERDALYFPTGLLLDYWRNPDTGKRDTDRPLLFVANSNADLRYNGGTITVLNLSGFGPDVGSMADHVRDNTLTCEPDRVDSTRWECPERPLIDARATIRIGDFPGELWLANRAEYDTPRIIVPVRGQNHLLWTEVQSQADGSVILHCNDKMESSCDPTTTDDCRFIECDARHRVDFSSRLQEELPDEPYGIYVHRMVAVHLDSDGARRTCLDGGLPLMSCFCEESDRCDCGSALRCDDDTLTSEERENCCKPRGTDCCVPATPVHHAYVTHLDEGEVSLFVSDASGVSLQDIGEDFFQSGSTALGGAFSVTASVPGDALSPIFVSSRMVGAVQAFVVRDDERIVQTGGIPYAPVTPPSGYRADTRGLSAGPAGSRLYAVSRTPDVLIAQDMTLVDGSLVDSEPLWTVALCNEPSKVVLGPNPETGGAVGALAYVVCFGEAKVMVVDTETAHVVGQIATGRGPDGFILDVGSQDPCGVDASCELTTETCVSGRCLKTANHRAFVANFLEGTVGVIDLEPTSSNYRRMVARIGMRRRLVED